MRLRPTIGAVWFTVSILSGALDAPVPEIHDEAPTSTHHPLLVLAREAALGYALGELAEVRFVVSNVVRILGDS